MRKIYISGPITGVKKYRKNFENAEKILDLKGYTVENPVTIGDRLHFPRTFSESDKYATYMRADLLALLGCTHIYMLDKWYNSRGAIIEYIVAKICGLKVIYSAAGKKEDMPWKPLLKLAIEIFID